MSASGNLRSTALCQLTCKDIDSRIEGGLNDILVPPAADSSWSGTGLDIAQTWLRRCDEEHASCAIYNTNTSTSGSHQPLAHISLPSRLVDTSCDNLRLVSLKHGDITNSEPYAALSHCWGTQRTGVLEKENLDQYLNSIPLENLPKPLIDAVRVCRDLKIRYLWADSLCIMQNSEED